MSKRKDPPKSYAERLDSIEAKIRQLAVEKDRAIKRFNRKFGYQALAIHELQQRIVQKIEASKDPDDFFSGFYSYKDGELTLWRESAFPQDVIALFDELRALRGDPPKVRWKPGWACVCGNNTSIWFRLYDRGSYGIYCENCWENIGTGSEDQMYEEVAREIAQDVTSWPERSRLKMNHYMLEKQIAERLGVNIQDLPPYIGTRGRTVEYYAEKFKDLPRQIAERKAEDEEDLSDLERRRRNYSE